MSNYVIPCIASNYVIPYIVSSYFIPYIASNYVIPYIVSNYVMPYIEEKMGRDDIASLPCFRAPFVYMLCMADRVEQTDVSELTDYFTVILTITVKQNKHDLRIL